MKLKDFLRQLTLKYQLWAFLNIPFQKLSMCLFWNDCLIIKFMYFLYYYRFEINFIVVYSVSTVISWKAPLFYWAFGLLLPLCCCKIIILWWTFLYTEPFVWVICQWRCWECADWVNDCGECFDVPFFNQLGGCSDWVGEGWGSGGLGWLRVSSCVTLGMVGTGRLKVVGFIWDWGLQAEWGLTDARSTDTRAQGQARDWGLDGEDHQHLGVIRSCGCCEGHLEWGGRKGEGGW